MLCAMVQGARDMKISEIVDEIQRSIPRSEAEISDDEQVEQADHDVEADLVKENRVQYQARHNQGDKKGKKIIPRLQQLPLCLGALQSKEALVSQMK